MKFGLVYPSSSSYVDLELFKAAAKKAEDSGFEVLFIWDHYMLPKSDKLPWSIRTFEAFEALSYVAALTTRIKLSTIVTPIPLRNIFTLAKMTSFLDFLCENRFILGAGLGWNDTEFHYYSERKSATERFRITERGLTTIQAMWRGSTNNGDFPEIDPRPTNPNSIPIWFGTTGNKMLKLCGKIGSGWIPSGISSEQFSTKVELISSLLRENHRSSDDFTFAVDLEDQFFQERSGDQLIARIEEYRNSGANFVCQTWLCDPLDKKRFLDKIDWYSKEVMSSF